MRNTLTKTHFNFPGQKNVYHGKVREVYTLGNDILLMIAKNGGKSFVAAIERWFGVGLNNFKVHYQEYSQDLGLDPRREERSPHSFYLLVLCIRFRLKFSWGRTFRPYQ